MSEDEEIDNLLRDRKLDQIEDLLSLMNERLNDYRKDRQELWGHINILEEQQEIMHNFLVEINKYLVKFSDNRKPD